MGVPRLFKYVSENYTNCIEYYKLDEFICYVDNLMFDANALIHNASHEINGISCLPSPYKNLSYEEKEVKIFEIFFRKIERFMRMFTPKKLLYIAIDGCAPMGKQSQQRQRRFISAKNRDEDTFDSCNITPGTMFMLRLTRFMNTKIRERMNTNNRYGGLWKGIQVYFSPPSVSGEGEHKVLNYVRDNYKKFSKEKTMLYGPDGDLIMLGLATYCDNFHIVREYVNEPTTTVRINSGLMGRYIANELSFTSTPKKVVINDFIFLGFFVGNDFLPKIQMFHMLEEGIETMITVYKKMGHSITKLEKFEKDTPVIDMKNMTKFINLIEEREHQLLESQINVNARDERFINRTLLECTYTTIGRNGVSSRRLDYKKYKANYYKKKFNIDMNNLSSEAYRNAIDTVCKDYMDGLYWVFKYYVEGCPSMRWYYKYHYAPLFSDFKRFINEHNYTPPIFDMKELTTSLPFQQLLTVLPVKSRYLLPKEYQKVMEGKNVERLYPNSFDIDYEGKLAEYQGIALLPFIEYNDMNILYSSVKPRLDYTRNKEGNNRLFTYNSNKHINYTSIYGDIKDCNVKCTIVE